MRWRSQNRRKYKSGRRLASAQCGHQRPEAAVRQRLVPGSCDSVLLDYSRFGYALNMTAITQPPAGMPELRELIRRARAYIANEIHFSDVCTAAASFRDAATLYNGNPMIREMATEWSSMATRVWPEFAEIANPVTEAEFRAWVQKQLAVFESLDLANVTARES